VKNEGKRLGNYLTLCMEENRKFVAVFRFFVTSI
jgi:hypothetical protein